MLFSSASSRWHALQQCSVSARSKPLFEAGDSVHSVIAGLQAIKEQISVACVFCLAFPVVCRTRSGQLNNGISSLPRASGCSTPDPTRAVAARTG